MASTGDENEAVCSLVMLLRVTLGFCGGAHPRPHFVAAGVKRHAALEVESANGTLDGRTPWSPRAIVRYGGEVTISKGTNGWRVSGDRGCCEDTWRPGQDRPLSQAGL